jgi:putative DNA primase/helicase
VIHISWFPAAKVKGPAYGEPETTTWDNFCGILEWYRREDDEKEGPNFVPARFKLEPGGKQVRRKAANLISRTAIAMDCETNKKTGEAPPDFAAAVEGVRQTGWAGIIYTSHNHRPDAPRYRIVLPLSGEIDYELPAVEVVADKLQLGGVLDQSKRGASSLFYLPSCPPGRLEEHDVAVVGGDPIDAAWICEAAGKVLADRQAEEERIAAEAQDEAENRRQAKIAAGSDPDESLIARLSVFLDLEQILLNHGYDRKSRGNFRHPNSESGSFGAYVKTFGGIDRIYSHNAGDPLHKGNLPSWCTVAAVDAVDATIILDYGGDRKKGLHELAKRFGLAKTDERKELAKLMFGLLRQRVSQEAFEGASLAEGTRLGLARPEVIEVAHNVVGKWRAAA